MPDFQTRLQAAIGADYVIERELGGGGMSRVFVATERALQRKVVVKVLPPDLSIGVSIERFRREIQLAAQLQHPHIVPLLTASNDRELLWFTMPFIEGSSLRKTLDRNRRLPPRDVLRILHDVVDALAYAHARGVVHRDIKPDNILTSGVHAMVTDFGVAKALSVAIPVAGHTTTGMAIGTPAYMAPEQLAADPAADHRVDIYAVGLLAYELLTGKTPFTSSSPQATLAAQLTVTPDAPHAVIDDIPAALSAVVMRCLEKDALKRYQSASELLVALDELPPMGGSGSVIAATGPGRRRKRMAVAAVAVLVVLAGAQQMLARSNERNVGRNSAGARGASRNPRVDTMRADPAASVSSVDNDNGRGVQVPVVITHAESLAIAEAIHSRMAQSPQKTAPAAPQAPASPSSATPSRAVGIAAAADSTRLRAESRVFIATSNGQVSVGREELLQEVRRIMSDSLQIAFARVDSSMAALPRAMRFEVPRVAGTRVTPIIAPPPSGKIRIVVNPLVPRGPVSDDMAKFSKESADAMRSALSRQDNIDIPDAALTQQANGNGDHLASAWRLRADYVVSGMYSQRNDSLVVLVHFNDARTGRFTRAMQTVVPMSEQRRAMEASTARVVSWLDTARTMPRTSGQRPPRVEFSKPPE